MNDVMVRMLPLSQSVESLSPYPWPRLRALLGGVTPLRNGPALDLSIGEPKFGVPAVAGPILSEAVDEWGRYMASDGTPVLRQAIADWIVRRYRLAPSAVDPERHVLPCCGTREALAMSLLLLDSRRCGSKSFVLMPDLFYPPYEAAACVAGLEPIYLPTSPESDHFPSLAALEREEGANELLSRTAAMFLCSPSSPQGTIASHAYLSRLITLCRRFGILLLLDECYSEIYRDAAPVGGLEVTMSMPERSFDNVLVFNSLSKRSSVPGLRSGFVAGDAAVIAAFRRLRSYSCVAMASPVQKLSAALWSDEAHVAETRRRYRANWDAAAGPFSRLFPFDPPAAGFFAWLDLSSCRLDGEAATIKLWAEEAIKVLPGRFLSRDTASGQNSGAPFIRIAMVHDAEVTGNAVGRIVRCLGKIVGSPGTDASAVLTSACG
ncbi:MAG: aminotransferase class I/II-fold pyridoxal phosphate-dependent enzyme [Hyphomicrobiales bacterium]|nr:aminotransferase class I/II-fold pyridoxal phosphate-dependent enzyme [Hyphomicrobiales bacterium]